MGGSSEECPRQRHSAGAFHECQSNLAGDGTPDVVIITKSDLLPHVDFSTDRCLGNVRAVNRSIRSFVLSATTGEGVGAWCVWLSAERAAAVAASV
jgi:hypothetical protein